MTALCGERRSSAASLDAVSNFGASPMNAKDVGWIAWFFSDMIRRAPEPLNSLWGRIIQRGIVLRGNSARELLNPENDR